MPGVYRRKVLYLNPDYLLHIVVVVECRYIEQYNHGSTVLLEPCSNFKVNLLSNYMRLEAKFSAFLKHL